MSNCYEIKPENFYEEIIADVYANKKTIGFLNNYPNLKSKLQLYIEKDKIFTDMNYQNYDVQKIINIINKLIKCDSNRYEYFDSIFPYGIISVLYNNNGTFKDIKTLMTEKEWNNYPKEVQYLIISSKAYLDDINYESTTKEELEIIEKSLEYTYNLEKKRHQNNEQLKFKIFKLSKQTKKSKCPDKKIFTMMIYY